MIRQDRTGEQTGAVASTFVSMGAEDFARYVELAPGTLVRLGCAENDSSTDLHSATFRLDEAALEVGVKTAIAALDTGGFGGTTRHDITYENSQARERTQILMDVANQVGGLLAGAAAVGVAAHAAASVVSRPCSRSRRACR